MFARIERFIRTGRVFINRGGDVQAVAAFLADAEIQFAIHHAARGGWWVEAL